jgi:hypothetical protein
MTTLMVFLFLNKKWIKGDTQELYNFTIWIAQSPPKLKNEVVKAVKMERPSVKPYSSVFKVSAFAQKN